MLEMMLEFIFFFLFFFFMDRKYNKNLWEPKLFSYQ